MFTIAGGIVLGFFAVYLIFAFADSLLNILASFFAVILVLAALGAGLCLCVLLASYIPHAKEVLTWATIAAIFGGLFLWALSFLSSLAKQLFSQVGPLYGIAIVGALGIAPPIAAYTAVQPITAANLLEWIVLTIGLSVPWFAFSWWALWTGSIIKRYFWPATSQAQKNTMKQPSPVD